MIRRILAEFGAIKIEKAPKISEKLLKSPEIAKMAYPSSFLMHFIIETKKTAKIQYPPPIRSIKYSEKMHKMNINAEEIRSTRRKAHSPDSRI